MTRSAWRTESWLALKKPFVLGSHEVYVTASIGIATSNTAYTRPQDVLRDADTAMYRAKAHGQIAAPDFRHCHACPRDETAADGKRPSPRD